MVKKLLKGKSVIIALLLVFLSAASQAFEKRVLPKVPFTSIYSDKIVYTTDATADVEELKKDCDRLGGKFNECGSVCDESSSKEIACPAVCAYTCDLK